MVDFIMKYGAKAIKEAGLEMWDNPSPERDYEINITFPEFTCLCPRSGYPDFAIIAINYVPSKKIVELKSLKLYLNSFRNSCISHEEATNRIYSELSRKLKPRFLEVIGDFNPRGNVKTVVRVSSEDKKRNKRHSTAETRRAQRLK
jgi:7-cyano-7-deazaguanine reductase